MNKINNSILDPYSHYGENIAYHGMPEAGFESTSFNENYLNAPTAARCYWIDENANHSSNIKQQQRLNYFGFTTYSITDIDYYLKLFD